MQNSTDKPSGNENVKTVAKPQGSGLDLTDSPDDIKHMQQEEVTLDLPDVSDIPGQEHVHIPTFGEMADTTISSDDEEGLGLFEEDDDEENAGIVMGTEADVLPAEEKELKTSNEDMPTLDDSNLREAALDNTDDEGELLNEGSSDADVSGEDLDIPGSEDDNLEEAIGEEDEENNTYSLGGDDQDDIPEDSF